MRAIELLLEYDLNKLKSLDLSKKSNDNSLPKNTTVKELADYLNDGSLTGELIFWLLHRYINSNYRWEDISRRIIPGLEKNTK